MADNVANIKERLDVVDVISGYIKLQKSGINYKGRCPFHNEKTPSFYVSPERQIWHCFGCQKGGDMFTFVQEMEGVEFPEALRTLATKAGVELEFTGMPEKKEDYSQLYEISELATRFFEKQLSLSKQGIKAYNYLKDRGLTDATIREFRLGFAPNDWRGLSDFLRSKGYKDSDIITAGVSLPGKEEGIYDRFRSRITFPIFDINDRVVGFTARIFSPDGPEPKDVGKYINTPQTPIYDKSKILYGLNKARSHTRQMGNCLLVEGNMDAIMAWQAGSKNVVATSGTALTQDHLKILKRYTTNLDFCFDIDQAGLSATRRGVGMALSQNFNVRAIQTDDPESKDPADYIKKFGDKWLKIVASPKPVLDFYFDNSRTHLDLNSVEGKKKILEVLAPFIKRLASNIERSHWVARLAAILKTREDVIEKDLVRVPDDLASYEVAPDKVSARAPEPKIEVVYDDPLGPALLAVIIKNPAIFTDDIKQLNPQLFKSPMTEIFESLKQENLAALDFPSFCAKFEGQAAMQLEFANLRAGELLEGFDTPLLKEEFGSIIRRTQKKNISAQLASLELEIKQAEEFGEAQRLPELLTQFSQLANQLKELA